MLNAARAIALIVGACATMGVHIAQAQSGVTLAEAPSRDVLVESATPLDEGLRATLDELFSRNRLRLVRARTGSSLLAGVQLNWRPGGVTITTTPETSKAERKHLGPITHEVEKQESEALFRETVAHVILGALDPIVALEDERETEATPIPPSAVPKAEEPAPKSSDGSFTFALGASGGPVILGSSETGFMIGGQGRLEYSAGLRPSISLGAGAVMPVLVDRVGVRSNVGLVPIRLAGSLEPWSSKPLSLELALRAGLDVVSFTPQSVDAGLVLSTATTRADVIVGAAFAARIHLDRALDLVATIGLDVDTTPRKWIVDNGAVPSAIFELGRARPYATLGIDWTVVGLETAALRSAAR